MLRYTEQVHVLFGTAMAATGAIAWWSERHPESPARRIWPVLSFLIGIFVFLPVDVGTGTYNHEGPWDTFLSVVPDSAAFWVQRWIRPLGQLHVIQHKATGVFAMVLGVIEYGRASGRLTSVRWAWVMPAALIAIGLALGVHGGSAKHLPSHVEQLHHWILGVGLGGSGVVLLLAQQGRLKAPAWRSLWTVALVILGLDLAFFYRIPGIGAGMS
jgi:hypothetical protein